MTGNELRSHMKRTGELDYLVFEQAGKRLYFSDKARISPSARALVLYTWLMQEAGEYLPRILYKSIKIPELLKATGMARSTFYRARKDLEALGVLRTKRHPHCLTFLILKRDLRQITAMDYLERCPASLVKTGVEHHSGYNIYSSTRQYNSQVQEVNIACTRSNKYTVHVSNRSVCMKKKKDQLDLSLPRLPDEAPRMKGKPLLVSKLAEEEHSFPYSNKGENVSAFWYWAIMRYKKAGIDFAVTADYIKKGSMLFARNITPLMADWAETMEYINWYLSRTDDFVKTTCTYNFNFLVSLACYNQFRAAQDKIQKIITTEEERRKVKTINPKSAEELRKMVRDKLKSMNLKIDPRSPKYDHF